MERAKSAAGVTAVQTGKKWETVLILGLSL